MTIAVYVCRSRVSSEALNMAGHDAVPEEQDSVAPSRYLCLSILGLPQAWDE